MKNDYLLRVRMPQRRTRCPGFRGVVLSIACLLLCKGALAKDQSAVASPLPEQVIVEDRVSGWRRTIDQPSAEDRKGQIAWKLQADSRTGDGEHRLLLELSNQSDQRRCLAVEYQFRFEGIDYAPMFAGVDPLPNWPENGELAYAYVRENSDWVRLGIPLATLFSRARDAGISFAADLTNKPIIPFEVRMRRDGAATYVIVRRPQVRLEKGGANEVVLFTKAHKGDWREGLGWIRAKWHELFTVPNGMAKYQWMFWGGANEVGDEGFARTLRENPLHRGICQVRPRPWFGMSISEEDPWLMVMDQKWFYLKNRTDLPGHPGKDANFHQAKEFMESLKPDEKLIADMKAATPVERTWTWAWLTHAQIRDLGRQIKGSGMEWLYYWNQSETWNLFAKEFYPESLYVPLSQDFWMDSTVLDPMPGSARAKDLVEQARHVFDEYPELDGLFMDQVYYDLTNPHADDGISIDEKGQPFSRHQWNTWRVIEKIRNLADERGKVLQSNFIYNSLEIASLTDFGLVEGCDPLQGASWFYDVGNRVHICQSHDERTDQECMLKGWQANLWNDPNAADNIGDRSSRQWLCRLMRPLMVMLQERSCLLDPHSLELPSGFEGAMFRLPDGNVMAAIITRGVSHRSPYQWSDLDVTVRLPEAQEIKRAYQLSSDRLGPVGVEFTRGGDHELRVQLPRHRSISVLLLARSGKVVSLQQETISSTGGQIQLLRDDLDQGTRQTSTVRVEPPPAGSEYASFQWTGYEPYWLPNRDVELDGKPTFELRVEPEIAIALAPSTDLIEQRHYRQLTSLLLPGTLSLPLGHDSEIQITAYNHSTQSRVVDVPVTATGLAVESNHVRLTIPAGGNARSSVKIRGQTVGPAEIRVSAADSEAKLAIEVIGDSLGPEEVKHVQTVSLLADSIAGDGVNQPIYLNGTQVGVFQQGIGTPVWDFQAAHELTAEAVHALKPTNTLQIDTGTGTSKFQIARPVLEVVLKDGRRYQMKADPLPQSTPADWLQAAGRRIAPGGKMSWAFPAEQAAKGATSN